jgi:large subunit ribosomal protein L10
VDRTQKEELVAEMRQTFSGTAVVVVTHYTGLTVADMSALRAKMRDQGAGFKVTKNRLTRLALDGTPYRGLSELFTGPTAIAYSDDPVAAPKVAADFAKSNPKLVLLGGGLGDKVLGVEDVKTLATLPSLDEIRGKLVGLLNAPATKVAGVLQAPAGQIARVLAARAEQGPAE